MDLPINLKPTFISMSIDFENLVIHDLSANSQFDLDTLESMFGINIDYNWIEKISIDSSSTSTWIWSPSSSKTSIVPVIYDHLNGFNASFDPWKGQENIRKLQVNLESKPLFGNRLMVNFLVGLTCAT